MLLPRSAASGVSSSAAAISAALAKRAAGCLASARATTCSSAAENVCSGARLASVGGASSQCARISARPLPANRRRPVSISNSTTPAAYRSVRASMAPPDDCSGAMYIGVPTAMPAVSWLELSRSLATPKSRMRACTSKPATSVSTMFSGLMSRCTMPWPWACASPDSTWRMIDSACRRGIGPRSSTSRRVSPLTNSITR